MTARTVIVTRPEREAAQWVADLRAAGLDAVALPLIVIAPVADAEPMRLAWARLADYAALMFVSATAVEHFFQHEAPGATAGRRFWATGPGTTRALLRAGVRRRGSTPRRPKPRASIPRRCGSACKARCRPACAC